MPNRILREGILTSPRMARLGWAEEVFYRRLHSVVDDFGRYYADHGLLRAACYPRQLNKVSDSDIGKWLGACSDAALVRVYPAQDGESYLEVLDFAQQVRAKKSKFPGLISTCAADAKHVPSNAHLGVVGDVSEGVFDSSVPKGTGGEPPVDLKRELYAAGKSLLESQGMPKAQCGSFITKLCTDYGNETALEAVRSAVSTQPLEAAAYLKATCQRLKGERRDPVTVPLDPAVIAAAAATKAAEAAHAEKVASQTPEQRAAVQARLAKARAVATGVLTAQGATA